jgi:lysozyme
MGIKNIGKAPGDPGFDQLSAADEKLLAGFKDLKPAKTGADTQEALLQKRYKDAADDQRLEEIRVGGDTGQEAKPLDAKTAEALALAAPEYINPMAVPVAISAMDLDLIKREEGYSSGSYTDGAGTGSHWTAGYGNTKDHTGRPFKQGDFVNRQQAETNLRFSLQRTLDSVRSVVSKPMDKWERAAFVSFAYNIGDAGFKNSTFLKLWNQGKKDEAFDAMLMWSKVTVNGKKQFSKALLDRRQRAIDYARNKGRFSAGAEQPDQWQTLVRQGRHVRPPTP